MREKPGVGHSPQKKGCQPSPDHKKAPRFDQTTGSQGSRQGKADLLKMLWGVGQLIPGRGTQGQEHARVGGRRSTSPYGGGGGCGGDFAGGRTPQQFANRQIGVPFYNGQPIL